MFNRVSTAIRKQNPTFKTGLGIGALGLAILVSTGASVVIARGHTDPDLSPGVQLSVDDIPLTARAAGKVTVGIPPLPIRPSASGEAGDGTGGVQVAKATPDRSDYDGFTENSMSPHRSELRDLTSLARPTLPLLAKTMVEWDEDRALEDEEQTHARATAIMEAATTREDYQRAFLLFEQAGLAGHAESAYRAGRLLQIGFTGVHDMFHARRLYALAAEQDHGQALYTLGLMTIQGEGGPANVSLGLSFLKSAARNDHADSRAFLERNEITF
ncbi:MAG: tetratricopeptide repeat protein [Magnetovibrionaceae bacterium]